MNFAEHVEEERRKMKMEKTDYRYMCVLYLATLLLAGIPALMMNTSVIVDETGTLANAAFLTGRNWHTGLVSSGGYYYKYGIAFLWYLPFLLISDSVMVYKVCGLVDAAFFALIPVLVYQISRCDLKIENRRGAFAISLASCWIGDVLFFSLDRRADVMLSVMNWVCLYVLLVLIREETQHHRKKRILYSILLSFVTVYAYALHTRGVVVMIAMVMILVLLRIFYKKIYVHPAAWISSMAIFLAADKVLQKLFRSSIWGSGAKHGTGVSISSIIKILLSISGLKSFFKLIIGWLFNAFTSTAGMVCVGCVAGVLILVQVLRRRENISESEFAISLFAILSFVGSTMVGILFFLKPLHRIFTGGSGGRYDRIVYGRYFTCALGLLVFLACYVLICRRDLFRIRAKICAICSYVVIFLLFAVKVTPWLEGDYIQRNIGVAAIFQSWLDVGETETMSQLAIALVLFGLLMLLLMLLILTLGSLKKAYSLCAITVVSGVVLYLCNAELLVLSYHEKRLEKIETVYECFDMLGDLYEEYPVVWAGSTYGTIRSYQMLLMDYDVMNSDYTDFDEVENAIIIQKNVPDQEELGEGSYYLLSDENYDVKNQDIVYIKGEQLKEELESRGIEVIPYKE
jgi:hypothetical protein